MCFPLASLLPRSPAYAGKCSMAPQAGPHAYASQATSVCAVWCADEPKVKEKAPNLQVSAQSFVMRNTQAYAVHMHQRPGMQLMFPGSTGRSSFSVKGSKECTLLSPLANNSPSGI